MKSAYERENPFAGRPVRTSTGFGVFLICANRKYRRSGKCSRSVEKEDCHTVSEQENVSPRGVGQSGTAKVKFVIDRQGKLISRELVESTGSELLDTAALSMVERAEPFPAPPAELSDDNFTFTLPIKFANRKQLPWAGGQWPAEWIDEQKKIDAKIRGICRGC
ncbi:energy transducer TonB family protein [Bradyrhizobium oligotrophicum S58]